MHVLHHQVHNPFMVLPRMIWIKFPQGTWGGLFICVECQVSLARVEGVGAQGGVVILWVGDILVACGAFTAVFSGRN